jgi:hypothetical protein
MKITYLVHRIDFIGVKGHRPARRRTPQPSRLRASPPQLHDAAVGGHDILVGQSKDVLVACVGVRRHPVRAARRSALADAQFGARGRAAGRCSGP